MKHKFIFEYLMWKKNFNCLVGGSILEIIEKSVNSFIKILKEFSIFNSVKQKTSNQKRLKVLIVHNIDLFSNQILEFFQNLAEDF